MRKIFALVSCLAMLFVACDNGNQDLQPTSKFQVTSSTLIESGADKYNGEITYKITTPVEGAQLEATADVDWITDVVCGESVTFSVEANATSQSRVGKITLTYDSDSIVVGVMQGSAAGDGGEATLKITSDRNMNFTAVGGDGKILYAIENNAEGLLPDATTQTAWISNISVEAESIDFKVEKNSSTSKRSGNIEVTLGSQKITVKVSQDGAANEPVLIAQSNVVRVGEQLTFTVIYNAEDVTADSKIYIYNTRDEVSNPITYSEIGEYIYYAEYNGKRSRVLTINVVPKATPDFVVDEQPDNFNFNYRMLIVNHTGVDCPNCPAMKSELKSMSENATYSNSMNIIYSHSYTTSDPCYAADDTTLKNYYKGVCAKSYMPFTGYPSATFNIQHDFCAGVTTVRQQADLLRKDVAEGAVSIASAIDGDHLIISAQLKTSVSQAYHIAVWMLEDDIYASQSGGYDSWMNTHHDVIRDCLTPISISDISGLEWGYAVANETSQRVFELPMKSNASWKRENFKFIVILSAPSKEHDGKYEVVNTTVCEIGKNKPFEYR